MESTFPCIFCRADTSTSRSVEHVLPVGLGNEEHILPPGLICDRCNHYFGSKIENPVLCSGYFQNLRARQALTTRSGNPLFSDALISTGADMFRASYCAFDRSVSIEDVSVSGRTKLIDAMSRASSGKLWIPHSGAPPNEKILSRFLAKVGLEIVAHRGLGQPGFKDWILDSQLDALRRWARYGEGVAVWPFRQRRIYAEDTLFDGEDNQEQYQVMHEFDLLITDANEIYAVICIFGEEFAINLGGPDLTGYDIWLKAHGGQSPLYDGKNTLKGNLEPP